MQNPVTLYSHLLTKSDSQVFFFFSWSKCSLSFYWGNEGGYLRAPMKRTMLFIGAINKIIPTYHPRLRSLNICKPRRIVDLGQLYDVLFLLLRIPAFKFLSSQLPFLKSVKEEERGPQSYQCQV